MALYVLDTTTRREVKRIFGLPEMRAYLENVRRIGAMGHVATDEEFDLLREAGAREEDPVRGAQDVLIVERIKELQLP